MLKKYFIIYMKGINMKKILLLRNIFFIISIIIYFYLVLINGNQYIYNMNYSKCIIFVLLISLFIFISGIVINKDKVYKRNINLYIFLFFILLFSITFFIGRRELKFYRWSFYGQYKPFKMIISQFKYGTKSSIYKNIFGNFVMLIPLSFLLMVKDKKYNNILKQSLIILPVIIFIELLQAYTHTGAFDIDDIILNYTGIIIFNCLITRFNIIDNIRKIFYFDFKLNNKIKKIIFYITLTLLVIYYIFLFIK